MDLQTLLAELTLGKAFVYACMGLLLILFGMMVVMNLIGFMYLRLASYDAKPGLEASYSIKTLFYQYNAAQKELTPRGLKLHKRGMKWMYRAIHMLPIVVFVGIITLTASYVTK